MVLENQCSISYVHVYPVNALQAKYSSYLKVTIFLWILFDIGLASSPGERAKNIGPKMTEMVYTGSNLLCTLACTISV